MLEHAPELRAELNDDEDGLGDSIISTLGLWSHRCQTILHQTLPHIAGALTPNPDQDSEADFVCKMLSASCFSTSESALLLVANYRLWDAEILVRSVLEGTYKFIYLCTSDERERGSRAHDYWHVLPEIYRLKSHLKVSAFLEMVDKVAGDSTDDKWRPLRDLMISEDEVVEIRQRLPKHVRRKLEDAWSFLPLAETLSKAEAPGASLYTGLAHLYATGSHQAHKDADGVGIAWERSRRDGERIKLI